MFDEQGYVVLEPGQVIDSAGTLQELLDRIDDIMLGRAELDYDKVGLPARLPAARVGTRVLSRTRGGRRPAVQLMMQLDSTTGKYEDIGEQTLGHKTSSLDYRKIQNLEHDRLFRKYIQHPVFEKACRRTYGDGAITVCLL